MSDDRTISDRFDKILHTRKTNIPLHAPSCYVELWGRNS